MDLIPIITLAVGLTATMTSTFLFSLERILKIKVQKMKIRKMIEKSGEAYDDIDLIAPDMNE